MAPEETGSPLGVETEPRSASSPPPGGAPGAWELAPKWRRIGALLIDLAIVLLTTGVGRLLLRAGTPLLENTAAVLLVLGLLFPVARDIIGGAGPGKRALGLRVIDDRTGQPAGPWRALTRQLSLYCLLPLLPDVVEFLRNEDGLALRDHVFGTSVCLPASTDTQRLGAPSATEQEHGRERAFAQAIAGWMVLQAVCFALVGAGVVPLAVMAALLIAPMERLAGPGGGAALSVLGALAAAVALVGLFAGCAAATLLQVRFLLRYLPLSIRRRRRWKLVAVLGVLILLWPGVLWPSGDYRGAVIIGALITGLSPVPIAGLALVHLLHPWYRGRSYVVMFRSFDSLADHGPLASVGRSLPQGHLLVLLVNPAGERSAWHSVISAQCGFSLRPRSWFPLLVRSEGFWKDDVHGLLSGAKAAVIDLNSDTPGLLEEIDMLESSELSVLRLVRRGVELPPSLSGRPNTRIAVDVPYSLRAQSATPEALVPRAVGIAFWTTLVVGFAAASAHMAGISNGVLVAGVLTLFGVGLTCAWRALRGTRIGANDEETIRRELELLLRQP
jgi:hypothetical protein